MVYEDSIRYVSDNCCSGRVSDVMKVFKRKSKPFREVLYTGTGNRWCDICHLYLPLLWDRNRRVFF